jgi:CRP-like cAMP-binding protein
MGAMPLPSGYSCGNRLLDALPALDAIGLEADVEVVFVPATRFTHAAGETMDHVDFPIDAVLSVVTTLANGDTVEVGAVGRESFVEADAGLDLLIAPRSSFCQVAGQVGRMPIARFQARMAASPSFARLMRHNVSATLFCAQQFAACNAKHAVVQRCARWLLMTADRVDASRFAMTHDFLAIMLGVRRAGVSEAAEALQGLGAIEYRRGTVTIVNRDLLERTSCECYGACRAAFDASLG